MISSASSLERLYKSSPLVDAPAPGSFVRGAEETSGAGFAETMSEVSKAAMNTLKTAETTAMNGMAGNADPHSVVEALTAAELALQTAVTVRDKAVEAYQEILRMPV